MLRRQFLTGGASIAGAVGLGCSAQLAGSAARSGAAPDRLEQIRSEFELEQGKVHLAGLLLASHPRPVREAIEAHRRGLDRNPVDYIHGIGYDFGNPIRKAITAYTGGEPEEIALTDSTTMGLGMLYTGLRLKAEDDILQTTHDHFVTDTALSYAAERSGARLRKVALYDASSEATASSMVERLIAQVVPETRLVAVTWVHSSTGVKLPIRAIADALEAINRQRAPERRILFSVDGVHGFGVENVEVAAFGCDFFSAGCHKWIFGPRGTGILWARRSAWAEVRPTIPPFELKVYGQWLGDPKAAGPIPFSEMMTPGGFHSFEHRWALPEAFKFHLELGKARIEQRIHALALELKQGLAGMKNVKLHTPLSEEVSAGIVCFEVPGRDPEAVMTELHAAGIVGSTTPYAKSYARFTPGIYNTREDVQAALRAVGALKG